VEDDVDVWSYAIVSCMPEMTTTTYMVVHTTRTRNTFCFTHKHRQTDTLKTEPAFVLTAGKNDIDTCPEYTGRNQKIFCSPNTSTKLARVP